VFAVLKQLFLDDANAVRHIEGTVVGSQLNEGLLLAVGADQSVDLGDLNVVQLLDGAADLGLGGAGLQNKNNKFTSTTKKCTATFL